MRELESALAGLGKPTTIHIYQGAGHAFYNDTRPDMYRRAAARDAWPRVLAFFEEHLGG